MSGALIFTKVREYAPEMITAVRRAGFDDVRLLVGSDATSIGEVEAYGLSEVYLMEGAFSNNSFASAVVRCSESFKPSVILGPSTKDCREIAARAAQRLRVGCLNDCVTIEVDGPSLKVSRTVYGGTYVAEQRAEFPVVVTLRVGRTKPEAVTAASKPKITRIDPEVDERVRFVEMRAVMKEAVDLTKAEIIVSVGRGFKKKEDIALAEELAREVGGEVGCTRPISGDLKWLSEDRHIGLSGKWVGPKLYIAIGVSGQMQHVAGIRGAKTIVAINNDSNAPIHRESDYSVIADLYQFLPVFIEKLRKAKTK
ncbi:MAG: electron transfer flavoprotein subunit alpha/FixB family protein [Aigarchaeota archaeon]|nr:electron transfer flavoprotein subunit alpha/FixB family protein [Aigarchaeota archaeon]MDW8093223.1 electron transfer flavoprotein subunit alpha/FixB family protein [Nitrososphaerota archaeon]